MGLLADISPLRSIMINQLTGKTDHSPLLNGFNNQQRWNNSNFTDAPCITTITYPTKPYQEPSAPNKKDV